MTSSTPPEKPAPVAPCALPTYLSWGIDGDDGPWVVRAECDGPRGCGWSRDLDEWPTPSAFGINGDEFAALDAEHRVPAKADACHALDANGTCWNAIGHCDGCPRPPAKADDARPYGACQTCGYSNATVRHLDQRDPVDVHNWCPGGVA